MARTVIPLLTVIRAGVVESSELSSDFTNGMYIEGNVDGHVRFRIKNTNAGTQTVVFKANRSVDDLALSDLTVSILTGVTRVYYYFAPVTFNQTYNDGAIDHFNCILINPSVNTDLKFTAEYLPSPQRAQ